MTNCAQCQQAFSVPSRDQSFYQRISVPSPTKCPQCRFQLRMSFRNERFLYQRECAMCQAPILSQYSADKPYTIYCRTCWWSDRWDPLDYARDYNPNQPFFLQFAELKKVVPRIGLLNDADSVNSDFCHRVNRMKNCYMVYDAVDNEDCLYGSGMYGNKDSIDCDYCDRVELCYDCSFCTECYGLQRSRDCLNCRDSAYLIDCIGVSNSLQCVGLRNVQYHYQNKPLTQAEFERLWTKRFELSDQFEQFSITIPRRFYNGVNTDDSSGDHLVNTHAVQHSFQVRDSESCSYCYGVHHAKDSYDYTIWGDQAELMYEAHACGGDTSRVMFANVVWFGHDTTYCDHCLNGAINCFGCVGLKNQQYCILNQQYAATEYTKLRDQLIDHMQQTGDWGNFFPPSVSDFCYNETVAHEFFPLTKEQAIMGGWTWQDHLPGTYGKADASKHIYDCIQCGKNFHLIPQELKFYEKQHIPLPQYCPDCRHDLRMRYRSPYRLWERQCMKTDCSNRFHTAYSPDRKEIIYCEGCYTKAIY